MELTLHELGHCFKSLRRFCELNVNLYFLIVEVTPFDLLIGLPSLEKIQACIDLGKQHVQITIGEQAMRLGLQMEAEKKKLSGRRRRVRISHRTLTPPPTLLRQVEVGWF